MKSFENKVAAITGAGSGIGRALAYHLARQGCHLALSDVNVEGLQETVEQARKLGVTVSGQRVDVADRAAVEAWAEPVSYTHLDVYKRQLCMLFDRYLNDQLRQRFSRVI